MSENVRRPRPVAGAQGKDLGDEYLFYDRDHDRVHVLNGTAREIYLLFDGERTEAEVAGTLAATYGIGADLAREDTSRLVEELAGLGLIEWS